MAHDPGLSGAAGRWPAGLSWVAHEWTALSNGAWRQTETVNTFEPLAGRVTAVDDKGDTSVATDDLCVRTSYAENTTTWKLDFPKQEETVSVACGVPPDRSKQLVSDTLTYYGGAFGAAPLQGNVTKTERAKVYDGTKTVYVKVADATHDAFGRATSVTDALGNKRTTAYTETNGLTTKSTVTGPPVIAGDATSAHVTVTDLDPAWAQPTMVTDPNKLITRLQYDGMGRLRKVWLPNQNSTQLTPNVDFTYRVADNAIVAVGTKELNARGGQKREAYQFFDGWLRPRQAQAPGPDGGRLIADTFYDSRGNTSRVYDTYYATGSPTPTLFGPYDGNVETQIAYSHDGVNRVLTERLLVGNNTGTEKWRTTYAYSGDRTHVTPPAGGTPTTTITDARDRTVELRQYKGASPIGEFYSTRYGYTPDGQLAKVTDHEQNIWSYTYDLRGRKTMQVDPDSKTTNYDYDDLDRLIYTEDARLKKLFHKYDAMGRKLETRADSATTGPVLTSWVYDTKRKGYLTSATRHVGTSQYTTSFDLFDALNRPNRTYVTIPAGEGLLSGSYLFGTQYRLDGTVQSTGFPEAGGLPGEAVVYTHDAEDLGRLVKLGGTSSYVTNTVYSFTGQLQQLELAAGAGPKTWITNSYEYGTNRLAKSRVERANVPGVDRHATYGYDPAGNITSIADVSRSGTDAQCFSYDSLRRLEKAWTQAVTDCAAAPSDAVVGGPAPYWHEFVYDPIGNRTKETQHGLGGVADTVRDYAYPPSGQLDSQPHTLTGVTHTGPDGTRSDSFVYNDAGSTESRTVDGKTQTLDWDNEGHLEKVTEDSKTTSFVYDASGQRLIRRDPDGTTLYLPGMELRVDNGATAAKATRYYSHNGQTVAIRTAAGVQFVANDHQGTPVLEINATDQTLTQRRYTPFGADRSMLGAWVGEKAFVGGTSDASIGLTHLGAREYDSQTGRFISIDPLIDHNDPQQMQGYAYANNSPATYSDPGGLIAGN